MSSICRHCFRKIGVLVERRQPDINHDRRSQGARRPQSQSGFGTKAGIKMENQAMLWGDRLRGTSNNNPTATG
jgi:hypothetical protein